MMIKDKRIFVLCRGVLTYALRRNIFLVCVGLLLHDDSKLHGLADAIPNLDEYAGITKG
jgi:hypothetical protein